MVKTYTCKDCKIEFNQKSHYDRHINKKIPCVLKDRPFKDIIDEAVLNQVSKIIKEDNKNIIISSKINEDETTKSKSIRKKPIKKK
jgi:hypothetical protein